MQPPSSRDSQKQKTTPMQMSRSPLSQISLNSLNHIDQCFDSESINGASTSTSHTQPSTIHEYTRKRRFVNQTSYTCNSTIECQHCGACMWYQGRKRKHRNATTPKLNYAERNSDGRIKNLLTVSEVFALIVEDIDSTSQRDIIMETQSGQLKKIDELHVAIWLSNIRYCFHMERMGIDVMSVTE
ncbi:hypothetical protein Lal_00033890 [Lupinus albus]|nr:hypothetical protein Lal_00033890 [Lupinus albus]